MCIRDRAEIQEFAYGTTKKVWVADPNYGVLSRAGLSINIDVMSRIQGGSYQDRAVPGKLSPPRQYSPADISTIGKPLESFVSATKESGLDLVVMFDGLDRLPSPEKFWAVVDHDFRAMHLLGVGVIATAPQSLLYGEGRAIAAHFDRTHQIRALNPDPESNDLKTVLVHRGGTELMDEECVGMLCRASGGVLRDLITLARDAGEEAYVEGDTTVRTHHARVAIQQMGEGYLRGLGPEQIAVLRRLIESGSFDVSSSPSIELLVMGRVLEYSASKFSVHPTLLAVLPASEDDPQAGERMEQR